MDLTNIGPYRVLEKLGAGGMGEVYLAQDTRLRRKVALKRLTGIELDSPEARHQLLREARAAAALNHPNIAAVYDVLDEEDESFIVMEYVEGDTLAKLLRRGALPSLDVVEIGIQLSDALAEAHAHGIIHRDFKPANVLMSSQGKVKILDFGLAKAPSTSESSLSASTGGRVVGTPAYMAPEQMLGYRADHRSDLYSLGVVLYQLSTGRWPFEGRDRQVLSLEERKTAVPRASDIEPNVPSRLSEILAHSMSWAPEERYQSAGELRQDLLRLSEELNDYPTKVRTPSSRSITARAVDRGVRSTRNRNLALASATAAVLVAGLLLWRGWGLQPELGGRESLPVVAVLPLVNVSGDPSIDYVGVGIAHTLITKLSAIPSVTMISRSATLQYVGENQDTRQIAKELGASFVVNGSLQRLGDMLHATVNLVRADDSVVWGSEYDGNIGDLFAFQRNLANGLAAALHLNLSPAEVEHLETPPTANVEAFAEYSQGRDFLERPQVPENLDRAIALFQSAVARDPEFALAHAALGEAFWEYFNRTTDSAWTDKARESAEEARRLDPGHPAVRHTLAIIYRGTGRVDEAIAELRGALSIQPNDDDAHALLGEILADQGRIDEAAEELKQAIDIRPNFWGHYYSLGIAYYNAGRLPDAALAFQRVTELQPDLADGFQALGATYHLMGDIDRAIPNYLKSIELGPSAAARSNLGTIYYRQGKFAEAAQSYLEALKLDSQRPLTHRNLGDAYQKLGRPEDARAAYREASKLDRNFLEVNPKDVAAMSRLAVVQAKLGESSDALGLVAQAVELAPSDKEALFSEAVVHALAGQTDEAIAALELAVSHGYSLTEVREDDDLASLRSLSQFKSIVERVQ